MTKEKIQENILRVLGRRGTMTKSTIKVYAANEESPESFGAALDELAKAGKIVTKDGIRAGSLIVSLPGQEGVKKKAPPKAPGKSPAAAKAPEKKVAPGNGNAPAELLAATIEALKRKRDHLNDAIRKLEEVTV